MKIFYVCDRRACETCHPPCTHTTDLRHAKNFEKFADAMIEKDIEETPKKEPDSVEIERLKKQIDDLKFENEYLKKRIKHLLESKFIASFDEKYNARSIGKTEYPYKRDIREADLCAEFFSDVLQFFAAHNFFKKV